MSKARAANPPPGECRQCWAHAHDPDAHKGLGFFEDCPLCLSHVGGCPPHMIVPKKPSIWI